MTIQSVDVCICTYLRPSLSATLASIAAQRLPAGVTLRVIVADNDVSDVRRTAILADAAQLGLHLHYVHAPSRNISVARNACLNAAQAPRIAFIDDDEEADPDWIACLLDKMTGADIVFGVSLARYDAPGIPNWVLEGDFHSNRLAGNDAPWNGYTANVMIDRTFIERRGWRFALELGQVGGEDTVFFHRAWRDGARFAYAPQAIVREDTPAHRATIAWLMRRRYRSGQIHFMLLQEQCRGRVRAALVALPKAAFCFGAAVASLPDPVRRVGNLLRGALHVGVVASALGFSPYTEYGDRQMHSAPPMPTEPAHGGDRTA